MIKTFEDQSYIQIDKSNNPGFIIISICARDTTNQDSVHILSVEVKKEEFQELIKDL